MGRHSQTELLPALTSSPDNLEPDYRPIEQRSVPAAPLWRSRMAVSAVLVIVVIAGTWWLFRWLQEPAGSSVEQQVELPTETEEHTAAPVTVTAHGTPAPQVIVHVAGEVREPGIVELAEGSRVIDAIDAAGGPTDAANLAGLNLAAVLNDGEQIMVPDESGTAPYPATDAADTSTGTNSGRVNLNTADDAMLQTLPGVGPAMSERIIEHRESVGPFTTMADLDAVSGIGPAMMEKLEGLVSW
ncbi:ComEA family DNA-binding protein [Citricoccus sp. NR2]|uniref:ComEA family DNA-binding protein n=1 Tax=Citricoccus sp. NR2 TaxID=3004095 RepID=UPI0022DE1635|nr:ComEA family DNA-binding protein [Citricoccus sp. NR2]WBL18211.1 ComEA family DNA-binding protein [Citricoccus sp. NR2]